MVSVEIMISAIPVILMLSLNAATTSLNIQTKKSYTASNMQAPIESEIAKAKNYDLSVDASKLKRRKNGGSDQLNWLTDTDFETKRVKRDDDDFVIWDNCPGELHYAVIDGELKCVAGDVDTGTSDRGAFAPLVKCSNGTISAVLPDGVKVCLERRRIKT